MCVFVCECVLDLHWRRCVSSREVLGGGGGGREGGSGRLKDIKVC